jgi:hypothetical protein
MREIEGRVLPTWRQLQEKEQERRKEAAVDVIQQAMKSFEQTADLLCFHETLCQAAQKLWGDIQQFAERVERETASLRKPI